MEDDPTVEYYKTLEKEAAEADDLAALKMMSDFLLGNEDLKRERKNAKLRYKRAKLIIPDLGENDVFDLIATPHNVLRKELERLYNMVEFFRKYPQASTCEHTKNFFAWWDHVASFLSCYFQAEQDVIFKLVSSMTYLPRELGADRRREVAESMHELMVCFNDSMKLISARPPAEPIQKVGKKLELFGVLLSYFRDTERLLTPILQDADEKDIARAYREYGKKLISTGRWRHFHLLLIVNGLPEPYAKVWTARSISKITMWNSKTYRSQFENTHIATVAHMIELMKTREGENYVNIAKSAKTQAGNAKFIDQSTADLHSLRMASNDTLSNQNLSGVISLTSVASQ
eukprot:Plantae.Rhodophyta-Purpureofilum_apyrenoidigerum.ctg15971.p1 GENE.Plantae.Rhodophyta-Purpureofilum_apyrenoidigerum.ctg15971~~Plantae.Rhodophyta-Purpureofilum_apyrenoidigerum.ctg15971.p1  ORF type:complete len:345 (+),score=93.42 Plantae.Rhodophyta-Purpureofilum_apyrenoidigerum.ctg15971:199-1233(+)